MFKEYCIANAVAPRVRDVNLVAPIVLVEVADVISACSVWGPRFSDSWIEIGLNFASKGSKWVGVVVMGIPEVHVC